MGALSAFRVIEPFIFALLKLWLLQTVHRISQPSSDSFCFRKESRQKHILIAWSFRKRNWEHADLDSLDSPQGSPSHSGDFSSTLEHLETYPDGLALTNFLQGGCFCLQISSPSSRTFKLASPFPDWKRSCLDTAILLSEGTGGRKKDKNDWQVQYWFPSIAEQMTLSRSAAVGGGETFGWHQGELRKASTEEAPTMDVGQGLSV